MKPLLILVLVFGCTKPQPRTPSQHNGPLSPAAYSHYLRGRLAAEARDYTTAALQFRAAIAAAPHQAQIRVALIEVLLRARDTRAAQDASQRAMKRFGESSAVWLAAGRVYERVANLREATRMIKRAIKLDQDNEPAYLLLAKVWRRRGRPKNTERAYRKLLAQNPASNDGNYQLGAHLLGRGDYDEAEPLLRRVIASKPDRLEAWVALARSQRARGRQGSARKTLQRAFDRSHGDPAVAEYLFRRLLDTEKRSFAVAMVRAIDRSDLNADTRIALGYLLIHGGKPRLAVSLANAVLQQSPNGEASILKASALTELERTQQALRVLMAVPKKDTNYAEARADAVELLARKGAYPRALMLARAALINHPKHADLIASRALTLELSGDIKTARQVFRTALAVQPKNTDLRLAFGSMEERLHRSRAAIRIVEPILDHEPNETRALNFIAYTLADRRLDLARAERLVRKAMRLAPLDGYVLDSYGWLLFRQRKLKAAQRVLARAVRLAPAEPEILWHLAELHLHRKHRRKALRLLVRAQKLRPQGRVKRRIEARIQALDRK